MTPDMRWIGLFVLSCVACADDSRCADGTLPKDGVCLAGCGDGTHLEDGLCVPDDRKYELRVAATDVSANGYSKYPVLAFGTKDDGTPALDDVVLGVDRPGSGEFTNPALPLRPLGATAYFVPCNATTPGCLGPVTLTLALASAPTVPIARTTIELVEPVGVGTAAPCLSGGNAMFFEGDNYIFAGTALVTAGQWSVYNTSSEQLLDLRVEPADIANGSSWEFRFDSSKVGKPLTAGVYDMAERWPFQAPEHPGLDIFGSGRSCGELTGRFEVQEHVRDASGLQRATVSFEQYCGAAPTPLRGCLHYER